MNSIKLKKIIRNEISRALVKENEDHEVKMAQQQLLVIARSAVELSQKIGTMEKDMPAWIQGHISQAEVYINQANAGYHEL
jgi:hypothetical protein